MERLDLSVVIPTYNRADTLVKTLRGLAQQRFAEEVAYEVWVVDDGSSDDTEAQVRKCQEDFPAPLHYRRQPNRKQGAARNLGAREARGRLLVFLGDDTVPMEDFLERHLESHRQGGEDILGVIGFTPWAADYQVTRFMEHIAQQGWQFGFALIDDPQDVPFNFLYTSNLSLRRSVFWDSGGFDEDFAEYGWEDIELSLRLKKQGLRIVYNRRAVAHHHHPTTLRSFLRRQRRVGFSAWTFYRKHPEMADFLNTQRLPQYSIQHRIKMALVQAACLITERWDRPDLSRYYPDLLSYHYNRGLLEACHE